jgi:hypothetical protein
MELLNLYCKVYKERYIFSFFIIIFILYFILTSLLNIEDNIFPILGGYGLLHLVLVAFVYNDKCKTFKIQKQKQECRDLFGDFVSDKKL